MTSSILLVRSAPGLCVPNTQEIASTTLDLPEPFGPTTTLTLLERSILTLSANDLKPFTTIDFKYIVTLLLQ